MSNSENQVLSVDGAISDGQLSLSDLAEFARRHYFSLLGGTLIGGALGLAVAYSLPAQWEANALIQVAQVGGGGAVEPPARVVARLMRESFSDDVARRMDASPAGTILKGELNGSIKVKVDKSDLIVLHLRAATPVKAARFANAVIEELASVHQKIGEPTIVRWRKELDEIEQRLKLVSSDAERLYLMLGEKGPEYNLYRAVLASNILLAREGNLRALRERKHALQEQLSPERTTATSTLGKIEISKRPVFPKKSIFAAVGLVIGLLMGVLLSVLRHAGTRKSA